MRGAKGGNNVASMLWNNLKHGGFISRIIKEGPLGEYNMVMDNCGGQNRNQMIIQFLMFLTEIAAFKDAANAYLVQGYTKNPCDRMFMLFKQHFYLKNIYTMQQLFNNLNQNDSIQAVK